MNDFLKIKTKFFSRFATPRLEARFDIKKEQSPLTLRYISFSFYIGRSGDNLHKHH